uniref:Uncharacterized protein n=1 Tax=Kryptolebias marmoratus TaxID=37003 RepID=A0A3Q3FRG9_KRYMA
MRGQGGGVRQREINQGGEKTVGFKATSQEKYCAKLQQWPWQYYWMNSPVAPGSTSGSGQQVYDLRNWVSYPFRSPKSFSSHPGGTQTKQADDWSALRNPPQAGQEYTIPPLLSRGSLTHFIIKEFDNTSIKNLQKIIAVALVYKVLMCIYETICIGVLINVGVTQPGSSTVQVKNKNFSIVFLFAVFITLLVFRHNRTVYDPNCEAPVVVKQRLLPK